MIQVDGLSLAYHGEFLFENASFNIQPKERCALVGRNGTGKSSLFRLIMGKETCIQYPICAGGKTVTGYIFSVR